MENAVFKTRELTGTSPESIEGAVQTAIGKASQWQITVKLGFNLD